MAPRDLDAYGIYEGKTVTLEFESGVVVEGKVITGTRDLRGRILLISFEECTVRYKDELLFTPDMGVYDMAIGKEVISAYAGSADVRSFGDVGKVSKNKSHKIVYSDRERALYKLYAEVREMRQNQSHNEPRIGEILTILKNDYPKDWLLALEMYELAGKNDLEIAVDLRTYLTKLKSDEKYTKLIDNGLRLIEESTPAEV